MVSSMQTRVPIRSIHPLLKENLNLLSIYCHAASRHQLLKKQTNSKNFDL
jgi:hypothetical protein